MFNFCAVEMDEARFNAGEFEVPEAAIENNLGEMRQELQGISDWLESNMDERIDWLLHKLINAADVDLALVRELAREMFNEDMRQAAIDALKPKENSASYRMLQALSIRKAA
jgi:primosomal protein N''